MRKVPTGAAIGYCHVVPPCEGRKNHKQVTDPVAIVFIILPFRLPHLSGQRLADFFDLLLACCIYTDQGPSRIVGPAIDCQNGLHGTDKVCVFRRRNTPGFIKPGFQFVVFNVRRTVSLEMRSTIWRWTSSSAYSCKVHWLGPSGGSEQASAMS